MEELIESIRANTKEKKWREEAASLMPRDLSSEYIEAFHTVWIENAHRIRDQIGNDSVVTKLLRHVLPNYSGGSILLYRGENLERWEEKSLGFCWTTDIDIARMFGQGLNAIKSGGVLLSCRCNSKWVIAPPNKHSMYLGENQFTVEPQKLSGVIEMEQYRPSE